MISLLKRERLLSKKAESRWIHNEDKIIIYNRGNVVFAFNFHPYKSFDGYFAPVAEPGEYEVVLSSDEGKFGGFDRVDTSYRYRTYETEHGWLGFNCYLPSRCAVVFKKVK